MNLCCFLSSWEIRSYFVCQIKRVSSDVGRPFDNFEALNVLNLILQGKNINCINDYDVINTFVAKLERSIVQLKKGNIVSFP